MPTTAALTSKVFAEKLKYHMKEQRYSQEKLAELMNVTQGLVSGWCLARHNPDRYQLPIIAEALKLSLDYLLDDRIPLYTSAQMEAEMEIRKLVRVLGPEVAYMRLIGVIVVKAVNSNLPVGPPVYVTGAEPIAPEPQAEGRPSKKNREAC